MEPMRFDLYENLSDYATRRQGELKSYAPKEDGSMIYERRKSGHSVTVERLLWLDGWEETTHEGGAEVHKQEMTLVVLKMVVASNDPDTRFGFMKATVLFEDPSENNSAENEPRVEAWAPFHSEERKNHTTAEIKKTTKTEGSLNVGYSGAQASAGYSREGEISWVRQDYEVAYSSVHASPRTHGRNGVTWVVEQNPRQAKAATQQVWTAVLLSRRTRSAYRVKFQIDVRAGSVQEFADKTRRVFGMDPRKSSPFLITPWEKDVCEYEGQDIIKCVDRYNLGKLRHQEDRTNLNVRWGPRYQIEPQTAWKDVMTEGQNGQDSEKGPDEDTKLHERPDRKPVASLPDLASVSAPTPAPSFPSASQLPAAAESLGLPPLMIGWYQGATPSTASCADLGRLTALEARIAQVEARLASQESTIWHLREILASKDSQMAKLEQMIATKMASDR